MTRCEKYLCGNKKFLQESGIDLKSEHNEALENLRPMAKKRAETEIARL